MAGTQECSIVVDFDHIGEHPDDQFQVVMRGTGAAFVSYAVFHISCDSFNNPVSAILLVTYFSAAVPILFAVAVSFLRRNLSTSAVLIMSPPGAGIGRCFGLCQ